LFQFHGIQVSEEANCTTFSSTLCNSCSSRLSQLKNPNVSSQVSKGIEQIIEKKKVLWTEYKFTKEVADCSVCRTFAEQMAGSRKKSRKASVQAASPQRKRTCVDSTEACRSNSIVDTFQP